MVFSSALFLFGFLPVLLFLYFLADRQYRNHILLIASLLFYSWGEPKCIFLMLLSIVINYFFGILVDQGRRLRKLCLIISVVYNLGVLFVFKYLNFTVGLYNYAFGRELSIKEIALPIGISFYTFQIMSYVIDVYRDNVKVQRNILQLALYVSLFPQLIAGPIVRYADIEKQITDRTVSWAKAREGVVRFAEGFSKKILLADQLSPLVDTCFAETYPSLYLHWIGAIAYTLQIYFDFSGYSDMAIGLGKIFGFDFLENFNYPYISQSIQEFWRRWHISLSTWFKDYLYIPLGGSRCGSRRTYINYLIVFFLTGLWHGASFNFIVWGLFYAVFIIVERMGVNNIIKKFPSVIRHIYALFVIVIGWVFFRAETLHAAADYIKGMFVFAENDIANLMFVMNKQYFFVILMGILLSVPHMRIMEFAKKNEVRCFAKDTILIVVFAFAIICMVGSGYSPFLYFRF